MNLRSRRYPAAMLCAVLAVPVLSACGGDSKADGPSGTTQAESYRRATCAARAEFQALAQLMAQKGSAPLNQVDLVSDKKSRMQFAEEMVNGVDAIVKQLDAAGVPDVAGGRTGAEAIVGAYRAVGDAFAAALKDLSEAKTDDRATYLAAVKKFQKALVDDTQLLGTEAAKQMANIDPAFNAILHCP